MDEVQCTQANLGKIRQGEHVVEVGDEHHVDPRHIEALKVRDSKLHRPVNENLLRKLLDLDICGVGIEAVLG